MYMCVYIHIYIYIHLCIYVAVRQLRGPNLRAALAGAEGVLRPSDNKQVDNIFSRCSF